MGRWGHRLFEGDNDLDRALVWVKHDRKYKAILLGALIMSTGAKIKDNDIQYLRQLAPEVKSNENFALPLFDSGFRSPGKRQFLAALDNYKPGTVRNFHEPSCHACGKTNQDMEKPLLRCSGCMTAWFCNKDCQRSLWKAHKPNCGGLKRSPAGFDVLNV